MICDLPESLFWYWVRERHDIYLRRAMGNPKPWTADPILQRYKFCNVYRELDRGTLWLRRNFIDPHWGAPLHLMLFNCAWYRMFNWIGTGEAIGWCRAWDPDHVRGILYDRQGRGLQVFTGAHIVYSPPGVPKVDAIVDLCSELFERRKDIAKVARKTRSLQATHTALKQTYGVGDFMAYEVVTDLRHTRVLSGATDIMTWANVGPGAMRGLRRLDSTAKRYYALERMRVLLAHAPSSFDLPMELRDIEHSLCEFDKYCRVKFNEGEPRSKYNGVA